MPTTLRPRAALAMTAASRFASSSSSSSNSSKASRSANTKSFNGAYSTPVPRAQSASTSPTPSTSSAPGSDGSKPRYSSVARRLTLAFVAAPIMIVTSYFMFNRVVLGRDSRKRLGDKGGGGTAAQGPGLMGEVETVGKND